MIWNPFLAMLLWAVVVGIAICRAAGTAAGSNHLAHASTVLYPAASLQQDLHDADTLLPRQRGAAAAPLLYMQKETVGKH